MAYFSGRRVNLGIGLETTRGTAVAPVYWYPNLDVKFQDKDTAVYNESSFGNIWKNNAKVTTLIAGDGSVTGKLYAKGLYYILAMLFGQLPTTTDTGGDTAAKNHAFALLNSNEHLTASMAVDEPNVKLRFPFAMVDSVKFKWTAKEYPTVELAFMSQKSSTSTFTVSYVDESEFIPKQAALKIATNLAGLTGAAVSTDIESLELEFKKSLSAHQTMDSGDTYGKIFNTDWEVSGKIEKLYNDTTYRGLVLNDTEQAMSFTLTDSINKAGTTTPTSLAFVMSKVAFDSHEPGYGKSDISTESINFTALMDVSSTPITATLVNKYTYA